ncbi:oxidoreductase [Leifsonia xyli subsp. cynodontis DSM 46306]|uniref:Ketoreductase (KR) domain-containing protein n=1 Tax=Leifsonia xyli subsp. cynodontis DSM 46306 TaxID=1389489 RepID=U3P8R3_LEIXC|nr:oxidoreductase [Leifsonia xyli subsp. cynodontis DSM 46306]
MTGPAPHGADGRLVLVAGATVLAVGTRREALEALIAAVPGVGAQAGDLADRDSVAELAMRIHRDFGALDGLIHLVGGWRGGGLAGQSDEDWDFLERGFRTPRNTTRVFADDLAASPAGRLAIVSSTAVESPSAGGANYAAAKAAADAWPLFGSAPAATGSPSSPDRGRRTGSPAPSCAPPSPGPTASSRCSVGRATGASTTLSPRTAPRTPERASIGRRSCCPATRMRCWRPCAA